MLINLSKKLPFSIYQDWMEHSANLRDNNQTVSLIEFAEFMSKLAPSFTTMMLENAFCNLNEKIVSHNSRKHQHKIHNTNSGIEQPWEYKCWYDECDDHEFKNCKNIKLISGLDLISLANEKNVCMNCGREEASDNCTKRELPQECYQHPGERHWWAFCPLRNAKNFDHEDETHYDSDDSHESGNTLFQASEENSIDDTNSNYSNDNDWPNDDEW
jgi:hypothetical protein